MVGHALTIALVGLAAVSNALPLESRQTLGPPVTSIGFGSTPLAPCNLSLPLTEQLGCIIVPITGGLEPTKRQITVGTSTCTLSDTLGFQEALHALIVAYGSYWDAPVNVQLVEQLLYTTLRYCKVEVDGWTGPIIPDSSIPGGEIVPSPKEKRTFILPGGTIPGGALVPVPTIPGGPIVVSP